MRWKILVVMIPVVLVVMGGQQLYTALKNPSAAKTTCAEYLAHPASGHWLSLAGCEPDWEGSAYESMAGSKDACVLFVPLRPAGAPEGETRLVLRTEDAAILAKVNAGELPDGLAAYEGLVQFGTNLKDKERKEVGDLLSGLAKDFVLLEHNAKPNLGLAIFCLALGLGIAAYVVLRFLRNRG